MAECIKHVATIGNSIIGVSVLAIPFCFKQCGIVLGALMLLLSALLTRFNCHLLLKGALLSRRKSFELFAFHSFGYYGKLAVETSIIGFLMGMLISFYVVIGDLGPPVISGKLDIENLPPLRSIVLIAIGLGVVLPLGLLKNIDSLGGISAISILFYIFLVLKVFLDAFPILVAGDWMDKVNFWRPQGVFQSLPIFAMALSCQTQIFEIYNVLPDPSLGKMNKLIKMAIYLSVTIYVSVGFFGYVAFCNDEIYGNVLVMMPSSYTTQLIKLGFIWSVVVSFPLVIFPCRASICSLFNTKKLHTALDVGVAYIPEDRFRSVTVFLVVSTLGLGIICPNIELVLGLVGSTIGTVICIIFPALLFVRVTNRETFERTGAQIVLCVGIFLLVTCTYMTISNKPDNIPAGNLAAIEKNIEDIVVHHQMVFTPESPNIKQTPVIPVKLPKVNVESKIIEPEQIKQISEETKEGRQEPPVPQEPDNSKIKNSINSNDTPEKQPPVETVTVTVEKPKSQDQNVKADDSTDGLAIKQEDLLKELAKQQKEILQQQKQVLAELKAHKELHLPVDNTAGVEKEPQQQQKQIVPQAPEVPVEREIYDETVKKLSLPPKTAPPVVKESQPQQKQAVQHEAPVIPKRQEAPQPKMLLPLQQEENIKRAKLVNEQSKLQKKTVQVEEPIKEKIIPQQPQNQQQKQLNSLPANAEEPSKNYSSVVKKKVPETNTNVPSKSITVADPADATKFIPAKSDTGVDQVDAKQPVPAKSNNDVNPQNTKEFVSIKPDPGDTNKFAPAVVDETNLSSSQSDNNKPKRSFESLNLVPNENSLLAGPVIPLKNNIVKDQVQQVDKEPSLSVDLKKNVKIVTEKAHIEIR